MTVSGEEMKVYKTTQRSGKNALYLITLYLYVKNIINNNNVVSGKIKQSKLSVTLSVLFVTWPRSILLSIF